MQFETIQIRHREDGVATLLLNRPEKHNALSAAMIGELHAASSLLATDSSVRVVVLTGAGASFCAGADLGWMRQQFDASRTEREAQALQLAAMLRAMNELPKLLIGAVNGHAYGGGLGLMSVCDVVIAVSSAKFAFTETRLGLIPATISPYVVARIGEAGARRLFLAGKAFGANEARELGLVSVVAEPAGLADATEAEVKPALACSPAAMAAAKSLIRDLVRPLDYKLVEMTASRLADCWEGEAREGVAAFFEKRLPAWRKI